MSIMTEFRSCPKQWAEQIEQRRASKQQKRVAPNKDPLLLKFLSKKRGGGGGVGRQRVGFIIAIRKTVNARC